MAFNKYGENFALDVSNLLQPKEALENAEITKRFIKMAKKLKRVAPKANDFLYGHCIMMHSAEAALVDQATGNPILDKQGRPVTAEFERFTLKNGKETVRWKCSDGAIKAFKNLNGDIFPEAELVKAHKLWIGLPLCKDHVSDSVDGIRGIIVDTFYDPKFKRVHALSAELGYLGD
jgi:hypothetical protein